MSVQLPGSQPYFIVRGIKPQWFSKVKNIIAYMGIASHVATKRAAAAGDPVVLRMPSCPHLFDDQLTPEQIISLIFRFPVSKMVKQYIEGQQIGQLHW